MLFDPTKPVFGSPDSSAEMRDQLNALKALMDAQAAQIASLSAQLADVPNQIAAAIAATSSNRPPHSQALFDARPVSDAAR